MSALRDQRIGRLLRARGCRALVQAEQGGTQLDNERRIAAWRNRYALTPREHRQHERMMYGPVRNTTKIASAH